MPSTIKCDVLVCGAGCAGLAAAIRAARSGADVLLIERAPFAGGIITCVGLPFFDGMIDKGTRRMVVRGLALEYLVRLGVCGPEARTLDDVAPEHREDYWASVDIPSTERFKLISDQLLSEHANLRVLFHSVACEVKTAGNGGRIAQLRIANKDGLVAIEPTVVIDATGDADVAFHAGVPVEISRPMMPMTLHFRIGNVKKHPDMHKAATAQLAEAVAAGEVQYCYGPGLMFKFADDEVYVHATRVAGDATSTADLTRCEMQGRREAYAMFTRWKKHVPGFEDSYYIASGPYIGVRETRRLVGRYVLTADDLRTQRAHDDAIATGCWYCDIHPPQATPGGIHGSGQGFQPQPYDIPYRALVAQQVDNLLVAGRCASATREAASSARVTATAMALGQAAGTAAALALKQRTTIAALDGVRVRQQLAAHHAGPHQDWP